MPAPFVPRLDILPAPQLRLWAEFGALPAEFVLYGGGFVKLSFFGLPDLPRLRPPDMAPDTGVRVAALLDLAGTKAAVVQMRAEAKDYLDIDAMLTRGGIDLPTVLAAARALYGPAFASLATLKALTFFADGNLSRLPAAVKARLAAAVRAVAPDQLPDITPCAEVAGR
jgi:hypothetical protein